MKAPRSFLLISLLVIGLGAVGAFWLHQRALRASKSPANRIFILGNQPLQDVNIPNRPEKSTEVVKQSITPVKSDFVLKIEKLSISAPIILDVIGTNEKIYLKALRDGVAHYKGTPKPGSGAGNIFIFGHSSYLEELAGNYKEVFRNLNNLKKGDSITISNKDKIYTYSVFVSKIVKDDDTSILKETSDEVLTISTCWPPGTVDKRYIIQAKRIK